MRILVDSLVVCGTPSPQIARERADAAYKVMYYQNGRAFNREPLIVVATGGGEPGNYRSNLIVKALKGLGVPFEQIRQEFDSRDTLDNIRNGVPLTQGRYIGFVSNGLHLIRVERLFSGLQREGAIDSDLEFVPVESKTRLRDLIYEIPAMILTQVRVRKGYKDARLNRGGASAAIGGLFYHPDYDKGGK